MAYRISLTRHDGSNLRLPTVFDGPVPNPQDQITITVESGHVNGVVQAVTKVLTLPGTGHVPANLPATVHVDEVAPHA